ncbi:TRAP transporter large permease [Planococcus sp. YIM B11945]|uniref:TRAP transporter large permease n=1 Tax=Planococcus sp. YIM B11945 TaxID=3435410 RepID=UPI003D7E2C52
MGLVGIALLFFLIVGVPIGIAFGLAALLGGNVAQIPLETFASVANQAVNSFPLLAIPLFILAGQIMSQGKIVKQLIDLSEMLLGKVRGSLGYVTVLASAFLGAITGSSVATVSAIGSTVGEKMVEKGYKRGYVASLIAGAGLLGVLIPPSIPLILYGATVGVSVSDLFLASMIPGIIMVLIFLITHRLMLNRVLGEPLGNGETEAEAATKIRSKRKTFLGSIPALFMPVIILGGIYSGLFTPTEAAAVACLYGLIIALVARSLKFPDLSRVFFISAVSSAAILSIIAFSNMFNFMITLEQIPQTIAEYAISITDNKYIFIILVTIILFIVGMFMETNAAVLLMGVLLAPAAIQFGINPIHFGIILVTNIEIGLLTPPMAANIYVSAKVNKSSLIEMLPFVFWFLGGAVILLYIIVFVPSLTTWFL